MIWIGLSNNKILYYILRLCLLRCKSFWHHGHRIKSLYMFKIPVDLQHNQIGLFKQKLILYLLWRNSIFIHFRVRFVIESFSFLIHSSFPINFLAFNLFFTFTDYYKIINQKNDMLIFHLIYQFLQKLQCFSIMH